MTRVFIDRKKILILFGTRPEVIKFAPIVKELKAQSQYFQTVTVSTGQHTDLLKPFLKIFDIRPDFDLNVMSANQTPSDVCAKVMSAMDKILAEEKPDVVLVQGDTSSALAGAMAAFHRKIPVGHVEAGLRSGNPLSPFPEEMNRRLISQVAKFHFAATDHNCETLISEGFDPENIFVTGNPVVDSLRSILRDFEPGEAIKSLLAETDGLKRVLLTTHRRESFGEVMAGNLTALRHFVEKHEDICLFFPVHPNPAVREAARAVLSEHPRIYLIDPLDYADFIHVLANAWLIVSDSGGVQEEAPSLGKPLLVLRENTERPEALWSGVARLVGNDPAEFARMLEENYDDTGDDSWIASVKKVANPFGDGTAAEKIAGILKNTLFYESFSNGAETLEFETAAAL
ncbi:MAG TPA: UDP-N-acetylglucosamine 2-epimerase (non-hydrolyzing) [Pyrinomonadaceae bacterium]|jgi:UDP-N-acetylglucosamine 2-epimerase (non-hydrolysing)|nr:UDP-N-acetylglucosamine 2-epimerase (non-hydrolyzing) [Pyrinomonadaceae bacterium]